MIDTRISTILVPAPRWSASDLPGTAGASFWELARDAADIERRSRKGVNMRGEGRRYARLCQRMKELCSSSFEEHDTMVRHWHSAAHSTGPYAISFLAISNLLVRWIRANERLADIREMTRIGKTFSSPEAIEVDLGLFATLSKSKSLEGMLQQCVTGDVFRSISSVVTAETCAEAFRYRFETLTAASESRCGLVDVVL